MRENFRLKHKLLHSHTGKNVILSINVAGILSGVNINLK